MVDKDFDSLKEYVIEGEDLKSWNNDPPFKLNCMYFKFTKAYKVEVQLFSDDNQIIAITDLLLWPNCYYEMKPTEIRLKFAEDKKPAVYPYQFYANPYFKGLGEGKFEPRVYLNSNISRVLVKKLLVFKEDPCSKYSLFLIRRAKDMHDIALEKARGQVYDLCMHFSRFCIEFSMKSVYAVFGKTFPHSHDIGRGFAPDLRQTIEKVSPEFAKSLPKLLWVSQQCIGPDRFDLYGDPESKTPPDLIVTETEAVNALNNAKFCHQQCCELFEKVMGEEHK